MTGAPTPAAAGRTAQGGGIRFDGVSVAYGRNTVLDRLDLTVEPGEVMALLGPSGSGKTTALRAVAGFVRPASGRVWLGDRDVTGLPPHKRGIGMVVQQYALFPHMRVQDNVAFGLKARKVAKAEIPARVAEALELVGMAAYAKRYRASSPAVSSSASPSPARSPSAPVSCCSTNRSPHSTPGCAPGCSPNWHGCTGSCRTSPSCTSPMTRSRR